MSSKSRGRRLTAALRALALVVAIIALSLPAEASSATRRPTGPIVIPPVARIYDHLSVAWWKYVLEEPASTNPLGDNTGGNCQDGQSGPVFFLVGTFGTGQITRNDCVVPFGKLLYFPMINAVDVHVPGDGLDTPELVWEDLQSTLAFRAESLFATVDGKPVRNLSPATSPYRACAGPSRGCAPDFSLDLPADNLFGLPAGTYAPAVADGFYLLLPPLSPGPHTITFGGTGNLGGPFSVDVVYNLQVGR